MTHEVQPYYVREPQNWAVEQERMRHIQPMYTVGELAMFVLLWTIRDFEVGRVVRCDQCYTSRGVIAEAYGQPSKNKCPYCYGTTFDGGFRAVIVRPVMINDTDPNQQFQNRGVPETEDINVETTPDFQINSGDYLFRATGERFALRAPSRNTLRSGFMAPYQADTKISYAALRASREDETSAAYIIPPDAHRLDQILTLYSRLPYAFADKEITRDALIPHTDLGYAMKLVVADRLKARFPSLRWPTETQGPEAP